MPKKEEVKEETPKKEEVKEQDIEVADPQELRPKELPLVIKGDWENPAQEEYARTLNGYAYANPEKWKVKKDVLIKNLRELAKNPQLIVKLRGNDAKLKFRNNQLEG